MTNKKTYLITGITGFLGALITKTLMQSEEYRDGNITIYGIIRNIEKAHQMYGDTDNQNLHFVQTDITSPNAFAELECIQIDYMIHCAASTRSAYMISNPVETADGIVMGTHNILELARKVQVKSMVYVSSMEVYGKTVDIGRTRTEEELGEVALESSRSCYPMAKRMAEHYCYIYHQEYGVPVCTARLAQVFGVGTSMEDTRVYMQFANAVVEKRDIVLKTTGISMGNYCASDDAVEAILLLLEKGQAGEVYNIVNEENTMSIMEMAKLVARELGENQIQVKVELEDSSKTGYAPDTQLRLSGEKMRSLGWCPKKNLIQMYKDILN